MYEMSEDLLGHRSGSDDDFILQGPSSYPKPAAVHTENDKIKTVRAQVAEVTKVMQANLGKVLARGDRLEDLQEASERLNLASADFHVAATRVRRRAWMQHLKTRALLAGVIALVLIGVTVPIIVHFTSESPKQAS
ncbi:vesicle-associated membrane protein 4-like isoform X2 [Bacillus rossius redtenbacheri]|uniref:vesicle-associated membrane protein 4-like isoform X2 n=1 Tax=Bacillus rossius redtenbacheri TaxID=93214 RepID=UPI002FDD37A2